MPKETFQLATAEARFFQRFAHFQANADPAPMFWDDFEADARHRAEKSAQTLFKHATMQLQHISEHAVKIENPSTCKEESESLAEYRADMKSRCAKLATICNLLSAIPDADLCRLWSVDIIQPFSSSEKNAVRNKRGRALDRSCFTSDVFFDVDASKKKGA